MFVVPNYMGSEVIRKSIGTLCEAKNTKYIKAIEEATLVPEADNLQFAKHHFVKHTACLILWGNVRQGFSDNIPLSNALASTSIVSACSCCISFRRL